jgi:pimeloyl-ACP methyl ester carboxylesterase
MPLATLNGNKFHYWQLGSGPDLALLHGLGGNLSVWHFGAVPKLRSSFRTLTYDLRGHGRSEMPSTGYTTRDGAYDLLALLDHLGVERTHLAGHSYGADIVLHFAMLFPDRVNRVVVIDPMLPFMYERYREDGWEGWRYWAEMLTELTGQEIPREHWSDLRYMLNVSFEVPILFGPFRGRPRDKIPITRLLSDTTIMADYEQFDELVVENLHKITSPTLLLYEDKSPFFESFHVLSTHLPNYEVVLLPETGLRHFSPLQQPEHILQEMTRFLAAEPVSVEADAESGHP